MPIPILTGTRCCRRVLTAAMAAFSLLPGTGMAATLDQVDWSSVSVFSQEFPTTNPLILFGFNPQPAPPGATGDWRTTATTASRSIDGVSGGQRFTILVGLEKGGSLDLTALPTATTIGLLLPAVQKVREASRSIVEIDFFTSSGGTPLNIVAFDPQPDPPAQLGAFDIWALQVGFTSLSTARVTFFVDDGDGNAVRLTQVPVPQVPQVPLPPAIALGLAAIGALGAVRLRGRTAPPSGASVISPEPPRSSAARA